MNYRWFPAALRRMIFALWIAAASVSAVRGQITDPFPAPIAKGNVQIELEPVLDGIVAPNYLTHAYDGSDRQFVVDQPGQVYLIDNGVPQTEPYLDASDLLVNLNAGFDERGLLGLAFHPDFENSGQPGFGKFYTYTSEPVGGQADFTVPIDPGTQFDNHSVVREWTVDPADNVITGDPGTISRELFRIDDPQSNHNAGQVTFGPDGHLYVTVGDGGSANDEANGHTDGLGNGQDTTNIFGNVLRIDPLGSNSSNGQYGIPGDNPLVGDAGALDEIYAYGLRNPFRFSFDVDPATGLDSPQTTGQLIVGDVGQGQVEEVDIIEPGGNYGWRFKEGSFYFNYKNGDIDDQPFDDPDLALPGDFDPIDPVLEYDHDEGISVIGGFVYRGSAIPGLAGKYVFGDFANGFGQPGRLFYGDLESDEIEELVIGLDDRSLGTQVKGFGQDAAGELYVLVGDGGPSGNSGQVLRIVRVPEPAAAILGLLGLCGTTLGRRSRGSRL